MWYSIGTAVLFIFMAAAIKHDLPIIAISGISFLLGSTSIAIELKKPIGGKEHKCK